MTIITRSLVTAALVSVSLLVDAPTGVSALDVSPQHAVRGFQRAAAHEEQARNMRLARRGSSSKAARCAARTTTSTSQKPTSTSSSHKSKPTDDDKGDSSDDHDDSGKDDSHDDGDSGDSDSHHSSGGSKPSLGAKKGLAWSNGEDDKLKYYVTSHVGTIYTWGPTCPSEAKDLGLKRASMLWGGDGDKVSAFADKYMDYPILMGMNECNLGSQSGMDPGWAYSLWKQFFLPNKDSKYLVTPSVTSAPDGVQWMQEFFGMCDDKFCGADAISLHYYGSSAGDLIDYVTNFRAQVGYPDVWLTEFACQEFSGDWHTCSSGEVWDMMSGVINWAENTDWVKMYSPYGMMHDLGNVGSANSLMDSDGKPSDLGYYYINTT